MVGLITDDNETAYKEEVRDLAVWCQDKHSVRPHSHRRGCSGVGRELLSATTWQVVPMHQLWKQQDPEQLVPPSHKTAK